MHPVLLEIPTPWGVLPVHAYGTMLGISFLTAWYILMRQGVNKQGLDEQVLGNAFLIAALSSIVGARCLFIATNPDDFQSLDQMIAINQGGMVAYGGFLGGTLGAWLYLRGKTPDFATFADLCAIPLCMGLALTRIGCYLFGCDYGVRLENDAPEWLRRLGTFPHWTDGLGSPAFLNHVAYYDLPRDALASYPVHPTQLYESLAGLLLAGSAVLLWRHRRFRGQVILGVTVLYGVWRFLVEYYRDDPERGFYFGFSTSQLISMALVPCCVLLGYMLFQRAQRST